MTQNRALLPVGFKDTLLNEAAKEAEIVASLLASFRQGGYALVKAPLVEFEAGLLARQSQTLANQTFRLLDPNSRQMMAIRADITPQIARIAKTRLNDEPRPLRLSYAGEVLRVTGEGLHAERELTQAGIELIGEHAADADLEVIQLAVNALKKLGLDELGIDLCLPMLSSALLQAYDFPESSAKALLEAIERKDVASIAALTESHRALGKILDACVRGGQAEGALKNFQSLALPASAKHWIATLTQIIKTLGGQPGLTLTLDPLEKRGFTYHSGVSFSIFSKAGQELGRGGRYQITGFGEPEDAVGFTLSVNTILRIIG